jgi:hypothetical protein
MSCRHRPLYSSVIADSLLSEILRAVDSRMTQAIEPLLVQYKVTELSLSQPHSMQLLNKLYA